MNKPLIFEALQEMLSVKVLTDVSMRKYTTWRIGGNADFLVFPASTDELSVLLIYLHENEIPWVVIGNGSNILVGDKGFHGVVIKMGEQFATTNWRDNQVDIDAGVLLPTLALEAAERSLSGLEFAAGIPGSMGGAVRMNAGAYGDTIGQYVTQIEVVTYTGSKQILTASDISFAYRNSSLFDVEALVSRVTLSLPRGSRDESLSKIRELLQLRSRNQPLEYPSCGSVFRNPPNDHAGRLIEMANLRGMQIGGAAVSKKHGNFIINIGGARAKDVVALIEEVQQRVYEYSGVRLETEVKMIGEFV